MTQPEDPTAVVKELPPIRTALVAWLMVTLFNPLIESTWWELFPPSRPLPPASVWGPYMAMRSLMGLAAGVVTYLAIRFLRGWPRLILGSSCSRW